MRKVVTFVLALGLVWGINQAAAQEKEAPKYGWQKEVVGSINLAQTTFDNWAQGGENSFAWQVNLNMKFVNDQEKYNWSNSGKFSFGMVKVGDGTTKKSVDEIKLESVFTYKLGVYVNPYVAATAETQFAKGYDYSVTPNVAISNFLDPAYFTQSVGLGIEPVKNLKTRIGAALKETVTRDYPVPYADDPNTPEVETTRVEMGAESVTDFSWKVSENTLFTTKLELFSNLKALDQVDVRWDNILSAKVAKYMDVNFNVKLFYDRDISRKRQLKQALTIGLTYSFL